MTARRATLPFAALCALAVGGAAVWTLTPTRLQANPPAAPAAVSEKMPEDVWAKGQVDRDNMVQGIMDYRNDDARR